jgi:hypothetical protein
VLGAFTTPSGYTLLTMMADTHKTRGQIQPGCRSNACDIHQHGPAVALGHQSSSAVWRSTVGFTGQTRCESFIGLHGLGEHPTKLGEGLGWRFRHLVVTHEGQELSKIKHSFDQPENEVLEWFPGVLARQISQKFGKVPVACAELKAKNREGVAQVFPAFRGDPVPLPHRGINFFLPRHEIIS